MTLHDLPISERPRERLVTHGVEVLSVQELLALVLGRGTAGEPVMMTAQKLLATFGSIGGIAEASLEQLQEIKGLGVAKACQLKAVAQLGRKVQEEVQDHMAGDAPSVVSPDVAAQLVRRVLVRFHTEHYVLLSLDSRNHLIGVDPLSIGTLDAALVHPRETFETAIRRHAAKVIVAHNHPSGDPSPSDDDIAITRRLVTAGKILGITVVDHVIVTRGGWQSLQGNGLM